LLANTADTAAGARGLRFTYLTEEAGGLLAGIVWIGFGAMVAAPLVAQLTWQIVLYAVLSLTLARMLPVAIAMAGSGSRRPTVAFLGWFGPRGLASVVFALIAIERQVPDAAWLAQVVACTVALSVIVHGLSSGPFVARYQRWFAAHTVQRPDAAEAGPATPLRFRRQPTADEAGATWQQMHAGRER